MKPNLTIKVPLTFKRADPAALAKFDPATKICTMNCGPHLNDPRSRKEAKFLCGDCLTVSVDPARGEDKTCLVLCKQHSDRTLEIVDYVEK